MNWAAIGDEVKRRRLELGLSQRAAASAAGVSTTTWLSLEKYGNAVNDLTARNVARALDWPADALDRLRVDAPMEGEAHGYDEAVARLSPGARAAVDWIIEADWRNG